MGKTNRLLNYILFILSFLLITSTLIFVGIHMSDVTSLFASNNEDIGQISSLPIIIIDAGHGGEDGGTVGTNGCFEKDINLDISFDLYELLKCSNIPVILTRNDDTLLYDTTIDYHGRKKVLDLAKRLEIAEKYDDSIFISIHQNAFGDPKYSGLQVYFSTNHPSSMALAENIQLLNKQILQPENKRKTKAADENIFLLDKISSPAVLVECGFLSNQRECELLSTDEYQKKIATVIYAAILNYFENYNIDY